MTENARQPDWTPGELAILLTSASLDAGVLAGADLPRRSVGAIDLVRQGLHLYHTGQPVHGILSGTMLRFLDERPGLLRECCYVCRNS